METATGAAPDPLVGRVLDGRYRLERTIARGGMATVYVAVDERLDRSVAVKVMHRSLAEDPDFVARFTREAKAAARLSSADVVAVYDQGRDETTGAAYLVMEHVDGITLRDVVRDRAPLPPGRALELLEPVLRALAAAHRAGIVHRDVKPENVLLGHDGRIKVADFGLARAVAASSLTRTTGLLIGTISYLAPEQVEHGTADPRSDVYAAGTVLWEALTGHPPFSGESPLQVAYRHVHEDVPAPSSVVAGIPRSLDALVLRATRRDPAARPADAGAFLAELRDVRAALAGPGHRSDVQPTLIVPRAPVPPAPPARRRRRRRPRTALVVALVVALLAALALAGGWYLGSGRYTTAPSLLGTTRASAVGALQAAGLRAGDGGTAYDEKLAAGLVLRQKPGPHGRVRRGGTVSLVLSKGPNLQPVPALVRTRLDEATTALDKAGLRRGQVTRAFSATVPDGQVISSAPAAGARLRLGARVNLVVSKGVEQLPVPDVRGRPRDEALAALRNAGFTTTVTEVFSETVDRDAVVAQNPAAGRAGRGSAVTLQVSKGPELVTVPDLRGSSGPQARRALEAIGLRGRAFDLPDGQGRVVTQTPRAGSQVRKGTTVTYYVL